MIVTIPRPLPNPPIVPPTPEQIAAARAEADALIAATGAPELFVNTSHGFAPSVRHVPSNLTCVFGGGSKNRLVIDASGVTCTTESPFMAIDLRAMRIAKPTPEADRASAAAEAIRGTLQVSTPPKALGPAFAIDKRSFGQAYSVDGERETRKVFVWVGAINGKEWALTQEVTSPSQMISRISGEGLLKMTFLRLSGVSPG